MRMISKALELYVEGGRASHIWCMCVGGHGYGGLGVGMEVVDDMHAGLIRGGWLYVGRCRSTSRV